MNFLRPISFITILIIGVLLKPALLSNDGLNTKIIGGSNATRRQFPYMVSVQKNHGLWCGGAIISKDWVISAAHCYETPDLQVNLTAVAGLLNFAESHPDVQTVPIVQVINHPDYIHIINDLVDHDISLLRLAYSLTYTEAVQPLGLPQPKKQPIGNAWLSGWGIYQLPSIEPSTLQCLEMPIITDEECRYLFTKVPQPYQLLKTFFCVKPTTRKESGCFGDSGGPLAQNGVLVGITSWSSLICGLEHGPTVFTKVSCYIDFIKEHVKDL